MKYLSAAVITLAAAAYPAHAATEDVLAAALKRIEALESKTDRLIEENKQLKQQLRKTSVTELKQQLKVSQPKTNITAPPTSAPNTLS